MFRVCSLLVLLAAPAMADPSGILRVIDGDTFDVGGQRVRLLGVDAPELGQPCADAAGREWDCGAWVRTEVSRRFDGARATCVAHDVDRYDRIVATCSANGTDIGASIVADGLAWAYRRYSNLYDLDEKGAAVRGVGLWALTIQNPSDYRAARVAAPAAPDGGCVIKGNISGSGRIYHVPGNEHYDGTRINTAKGERWFCSEAEARAAGWRAARR